MNKEKLVYNLIIHHPNPAGNYYKIVGITSRVICFSSRNIIIYPMMSTTDIKIYTNKDYIEVDGNYFSCYNKKLKEMIDKYR